MNFQHYEYGIWIWTCLRCLNVIRVGWNYLNMDDIRRTEIWFSDHFFYIVWKYFEFIWFGYSLDLTLYYPWPTLSRLSGGFLSLCAGNREKQQSVTSYLKNECWYNCNQIRECTAISSWCIIKMFKRLIVCEKN